jgi:HEAT repeat protein
MRRFVATRVAEVQAPDPTSFSEVYFERIAVEDPARLIELLSSGEIDATLLTFAAEIAGRRMSSEQVVPSLLKLLHHERAVVREGAIYGLREHLSEEVSIAIQAMVETDPSQGFEKRRKGSLSQHDNPPSP